MRVEVVKEIPVRSVLVRERIRPLDPANVNALRESFELTFQLVPIAVTGEGVLLDGLHRLEAARLLGWETIRASVFAEVSDEQARRMEIEANIVRLNHAPIELEAAYEEARGRRKPYQNRQVWQASELFCEGCGQRFTQTRSNQRFCSPGCRVATHRMHQSRRRAEDAILASTRHCEGCGMSLAGRTSRARYCSTSCRTREWKQTQK